MKSIDKLLAPLIFLSFVILSCYFFFYYRFAFNFEIDGNGQYFSVFAALSCWSLFLLMSLLLKKRPYFMQALIMLIVTVFILYLLFSRYYSFANEYFTNITVIMLLCAMLLSAGVRTLHFLIAFLAAIFLWQLFLAFKQMHGFSFRIQRLNIQGTLQNSGVFSCYLVSQLQLLYYLFFCMPNPFARQKEPVTAEQAAPFFKSSKIIVFSIIFGLVVFIVWQSQSRTALIALGVLLLAFFILHATAAKMFIYKLPKPLSLSAACVLLAGLGIAARHLFFLKRLSAVGRVMALDISTGHLRDHFWLGTGIGRFTWYYPQWQAQYFDMHPAPSKDYFLAAGENYIILNEYVQLFQTIGLPGFIAFILLLIWFFTARSTSHRPLLNAAKLTVITILVCGLSSYPFHVNIMLLLLAFCFSVAGVVNTNRRFMFKVSRISDQVPNAVARLFPVVLTGIAWVAAYSAFGRWQAKQDWDKLRGRPDHSRAEIKTEYVRLGKLLRHDGKFLTEYGVFLSEDSADGGKASGILEKAKGYFISKVTLEALAHAYKETGNYGKTIESYEWLCHYLPHGFETKLELLELYDDAGDTVNAGKIAHTILSMPVKIPSPEVDRVKYEAERILNRLK
jgi:hypothetical protein